MNDLDELERELGPMLRSTFDACIHEPDTRAGLPAQPVEAGPPVPDPAEGSRNLPGRRRVVGALAVAAVAIGVIGMAVAAGRDGRPNTPISPASTPSVDPASPVTTVADASPGTRQDSTATVPSDPDAATPDDLGIALPSHVPEGYVLDDVEVTRNWSPRVRQPIPDRTRYVHRVDGDIDARVTLSSQPLDDQFDRDKGSITVHGNRAQIFDSGEGIYVVWTEAGRILTVTTDGVGWDDTAALAERTIVDATTGSVALPAGSEFEVVDLPPAPSADAAGMSISYRSGGDQDGRIGINRWPNTGQDTLELLEFRMTQQDWDVAPANVNGHPAIVLTPPTSESTAPLQLQWIEGDAIWNIGARLPADTLIEIANGLEASSLEHARQLRAELDDALAELPELDHTLLDNGIEISIHSIGNGVGAYCVHQPERFCERVIGESSMGGEYQDAFTRTAWIADQPWMIGWAEGEHQPTLYTEGGSTDPVADAVDGSIVQVGGAGTFVVVPAPADDLQFSFDPDSFPVFSATVNGDADSNLLR